MHKKDEIKWLFVEIQINVRKWEWGRYAKKKNTINWLLVDLKDEVRKMGRGLLLVCLQRQTKNCAC